MSEKLVCIDPGHGGRDSGAIGPGGTMESGVNLRVGWLVKAELRMQGVISRLTRESNVHIALPVRSLIANEGEAGLFVSIHCNCGDDLQRLKVPRPYPPSGYKYDQTAHGFEVFHYPNSPEGIKLATAIRDAAPKRWAMPHGIDGYEFKMRGSRNGLKADGRKAVLRHTKMPAVLVELAFISKPDEEGLLASDAGQLVFARAIAVALRAML